eukprot:CAMPEP_0204406086 /NCGR_PEP_ID=MMETSP0470-20130426/7817_1 /ASSEMBLY_ACC=CAM_ASM_000385 /TAXON_ID=2969 /ORGANISM="Oxyrrhis marina" /LENGTH=90 /DNA_ID=CAMNT_0051401605 /DNA_START=16 /DNA_END=288 /DNA_ORIENTATION=-
MAEDLEELFLDVAGDSLEKVWVDYDNTDRSLGTGGARFASSAVAGKAVSRFSGVVIEGKAIHISVEACSPQAGLSVTRVVSAGKRGRVPW